MSIVSKLLRAETVDQMTRWRLERPEQTHSENKSWGAQTCGLSTQETNSTTRKWQATPGMAASQIQEVFWIHQQHRSLTKDLLEFIPPSKRRSGLRSLLRNDLISSSEINPPLHATLQALRTYILCQDYLGELQPLCPPPQLYLCFPIIWILLYGRKKKKRKTSNFYFLLVFSNSLPHDFCS